MSSVYQLVSSSASPILLADAKLYLRVESTDDDVLIQTIIDACTEYGESYTRRCFRAQVWKLLLDSFANPIEIKRQIVATISSITHIVSGSPVTVTADDYYLKQTVQGAEILLTSTAEWPTDTDEREQAIEVNFTTTAWTRHAAIIKDALLRHIAYVYANRGDCADSSQYATSNTAKLSGASSLYDMMAIVRV